MRNVAKQNRRKITFAIYIIRYMGEPPTDAPPRKQQQLLQSCQRCVPTASYNVLNPQQDRTPAPWGGPGEGLLLSPFFTLFQNFLPFSFWLLYIFCNFGALIGEAAYLHTTLVVVTRVAETNAIFAPCSRRALHSREGWWETGHDIY